MTTGITTANLLEAERLYQLAHDLRTTTDLRNAIRFYERLLETLDLTDTDRAFELAARVREMRGWDT